MRSEEAMGLWSGEAMGLWSSCGESGTVCVKVGCVCFGGMPRMFMFLWDVPDVYLLVGCPGCLRIF